MSDFTKAVNKFLKHDPKKELKLMHGIWDKLKISSEKPIENEVKMVNKKGLKPRSR